MDKDDTKPVVDIEVDVDVVVKERSQFWSTTDHRLYKANTQNSAIAENPRDNAQFLSNSVGCQCFSAD